MGQVLNTNSDSMYRTKNNGFVVPPDDHNALEAAMIDVFPYKTRKTPSSSFKDQESVFVAIEKLLEDYQKQVNL